MFLLYGARLCLALGILCPAWGQDGSFAMELGFASRCRFLVLLGGRTAHFSLTRYVRAGGERGIYPFGA